MTKRLRIIVACGSGVATSNVAAEKLKNVLEDRGLDHIVRAVSFGALETEQNISDVLVSITPYATRDAELKIPSLNGIPLLTGVGISALIDQIVALSE